MNAQPDTDKPTYPSLSSVRTYFCIKPHATRTIPDSELDWVFTVIGMHTGIDRATAERKLNQGEFIDHPVFKVWRM